MILGLIGSQIYLPKSKNRQEISLVAWIHQPRLLWTCIHFNFTKLTFELSYKCLHAIKLFDCCLDVSLVLGGLDFFNIYAPTYEQVGTKCIMYATNRMLTCRLCSVYLKVPRYLPIQVNYYLTCTCKTFIMACLVNLCWL